MRKAFKSMLLAIMTLIAGTVAYAQVTTSSMAGRITDTKGEAVPGATVIAVHVPSGTQYYAVAGNEGRYAIQGMRPGGPYEVTISLLGYEEAKVSNVSLQLGETKTLSQVLAETSMAIDESVVVANVDAAKTGASQAIGRQTIEEMKMMYAETLDEALAMARKIVGEKAKITVIPNGISVIVAE